MIEKDMVTASNYYNHDQYSTSSSIELNDHQLASRSVPGSRRNSSDEKNLYNTDTITTPHDTPIDFLMKPPPRSFSIDVGSMHNTNYSLFVEENDSSAAAFRSHPHYSHPRYNDSNNNALNNNHISNASYGLFASSASDLDLDSSLRKNSTKSVESLRSKSWAQFLDTTSYNDRPCMGTGPLDVQQDTQAAFYGQPARQFSQGWPPTTDRRYEHLCALKSSSRLATSYSYSDIQTPPYRTQLHHHNTPMAPNADVCQHFRQYGYCALKEQCPYSHMPTALLHQQQLMNDGIMGYQNSASSNYLHHQAPPPPHPTMRYSSSATTTMDSYYDTSLKPNSPLFNAMINQQQTPERRTSNSTDPELNKYTGATLEEFKGKLYELCKDQNGCRFLQTKLEESAVHVTAIYEEIHTHFVDLMIDPFGNYLCQKLLERCDDAQRTSIVEVIAPQFLKICLSMHGTRAVQKLIEFLSTKRQIQAVTVALHPNVVALIKDLNGNHVIQKCLHRLSPGHNQFIYDTVSEHCIEVASHKHGCCVYQRCIDHAVQSQKVQLVNVITQHALPLVQDPFGNYVVQYVLGLEDVMIYDDLIRKFIEPIRELSVQKFSSNVIEKCIRVAKKDTRRLLIDGIIQHPNMDRFIRDSYANYVIQTCLDCADDDQRNQFIDCIRPLLPPIRNTPYGKRIYSKIHRGNMSNSSSTRTNTSSSSSATAVRHFGQQPRMFDSTIIQGMNALNFNCTTAVSSSTQWQ